MFERIHIIIALLAGLLVTAFSIIYRIPFDVFTFRLSVTICVFYVIGFFIKAYLKRNIFLNKSSYFLEEDVSPNPKPEKKKDSEDEESDESIETQDS